MIAIVTYLAFMVFGAVLHHGLVELRAWRAERAVWRNADAIMKREQQRYRECFPLRIDDQQLTADYYRAEYPKKRKRQLVRVK